VGSPIVLGLANDFLTKFSLLFHLIDLEWSVQELEADFLPLSFENYLNSFKLGIFYLL